MRVRCTTPLTVLECERDPTAAEREIVRAGKLAIEEGGAEAICLGCAGMLFDYGLATSRVAAFKRPEEKEHLRRSEPTASR